MSKKLVAGLLCALACSIACKHEQSPASSASRGADTPLAVKRGLLIASGLGSINGLQHTNSVEALRCNYQRGFRWFEVDVSSTVEGELVSFHDGDEKVAGLPDQISNLSIADVEKRKYAERFPIVRFSKLLDEADRLSDVVFVVDADGWPARLEHAFSRSMGYGPKHATRVILQAFAEKDLEQIAPLSKELGTGLLLNLRYSDADDSKVEELAKKNSFLAVVATTARFTPWLAEHLHAAQIPLLVQNVNEHPQIVSLARAGADGFFTDRYVPYESIAADPTAVMDCGETKPTPAQLRSWSERNIDKPSDFRLSGCAKRKAGRIELADCDEHAALRSNLLGVPGAQTLHIELEVEAGETAASFWLELAQKKQPKVVRPREVVSLKPRERRSLKYDLELPQGSQGIEARLGVSSKKDALVVHRLVMFHGEKAPDNVAAPPGSAQDAGE